MAGPKYTKYTTETYPDPEATEGFGGQITGYTEDDWNRALEARRRYLAYLEWRRAHPFLAGARNFLDRTGLFFNDEIVLNKGNIRVRNAQLHPEGLKWFREGGNEAVALLGLGTAPMWVPEVAAALPTLSGTGEGALLSKVVPPITLKSAPLTANFINWGLGGLTAYTLGRTLSENRPTFSTPSFSTPFSYSRVMATSAPTDSVAPANPAAPTDRVGSAPTSTPGPEPERNDSNNNKPSSDKGSKSRWLWETSKNSPKSSAVGRSLRNWGLRVPLYGTAANWGLPTIGNTISFINTGKTPLKFPLSSYIPGVFDNDSTTNNKEIEQLRLELDSLKNASIQSLNVQQPDSSAIVSYSLNDL